MTYAQVTDEVRRLTLAEKLALVDVLLRDLRKAMMAPASEPSASTQTPTVEDKLRVVDDLAGSLRTGDGAALTDDAIADAYTDDLMRKHLADFRGGQP